MTKAARTVPLRVAVLGFGEAGREIADDLVTAGADVRGFDPKVAAPQAVRQRDSEAEAVRDAELVFSRRRRCARAGPRCGRARPLSSRRTEEMEAAATQLAHLGVTPRITAATRDALRAIAESGELR